MRAPRRAPGREWTRSDPGSESKDKGVTLTRCLRRPVLWEPGVGFPGRPVCLVRPSTRPGDGPTSSQSLACAGPPTSPMMIASSVAGQLLVVNQRHLWATVGTVPLPD